MAEIKIIKGTYGYCDRNGTIKPKTAKDGAFELNDKRAAELVRDGVAVYVGDVGDEPLIDDETGDVVVGMVPEYSVDMKAAELRDIAKEHMGLTFAVGTTKAEMVEQMDAFIDAHTVEGDELPSFDLDEVVQ
ncbi:MAG: hypothetical protein UDB11_00675 [Peptococcaceae bacterium]|nr:hypothetical protein [Peptococcaceae bacterium]